MGRGGGGGGGGEGGEGIIVIPASGFAFRVYHRPRVLSISTPWRITISWLIYTGLVIFDALLSEFDN